MKDNKYYVPESHTELIEHILSEGEIEFSKQLSSRMITAMRFGDLEKNLLNLCLFIESCNVEFSNGELVKRTIPLEQYRIKYLDKSDIESLGFREEDFSHLDIGIFTKVFTKFGENKDKRSYGITIFTGNTVDSTYIKIDGAISPGAVYGHLGTTMFKGNVKNRTELKKVLKMLNII